VKLLFDANLAPRLPTLLRDLYPDSEHVFGCGEIADDDDLIWNFAKSNSLVIVSKDRDFQTMSLVFGAPPKVILLRLGNSATSAIEQALRKNYVQIQNFISSRDKALLVIGR
jgi:predicted nuclease of predicted toxin-antitoxin system